MKKHWHPIAHKRSDGKSFVQEERQPQQHWSWDKTAQGSRCRRHRIPATRDIMAQWRHNQFEPRERCNFVTGQQGSKTPVASFRTKVVWRPVPVARQDGTPVLDKNGKQVIRFTKMGLQNIVTVTVYGSTVVFKKMQRSETVRDSRDGKSHNHRVIRAELTRLLGLLRGLKGYDLLMQVAAE